MDNLWITFNGLIIGLAIAAPVGPIGLLCMRQTLTYGWKIGVATGLGAASADAVYGSVAALGLSAISQVLVAHQTGIRILGGLFLAYVGGQSCVRLPAPATSSANTATVLDQPDALLHNPLLHNPLLHNPLLHNSLWQNYSTTFLLTLTNPATILMFLGIFSGQPQLSSSGQSALLVLGVFLGSSLWWLTLSSVVNLIRHKLSNRILRWINQCAGLIILGFGIAIVLQVFWASP